jgi:exopolysaccharide biosynthesis polyprenyl glycosylphosphotransferase
MGIKLCLLPDIYDHTISRCRTSSLNGNPVLLYHSVPDDRAALFFKGTMDRLGALVGILLTWPILLIAAVAIKIDSHGPVIYRQKRSGRNGKLFNMLKLRTMTNGADKEKEKLAHLNEMSGPVFKIKNDPRVTKVGKILRMYSIDELPQLFNVLKGDMSLVGPRPPLPQEVEHYAPWQHRRLSVKPGVTCLWQINGRNKVDFNEWMKLDLQYIDRWSLKEDARILAKTFPAVVKGDGAS